MSGGVSSGADVACCAPAGAWAAGASLTGLTDVRMLRTLRKVACCFGLPFQETSATSCRNIGSSCFSANLTGFDGSEKVKGPEIYFGLGDDVTRARPIRWIDDPAQILEGSADDGRHRCAGDQGLRVLSYDRAHRVYP